MLYEVITFQTLGPFIGFAAPDGGDDLFIRADGVDDVPVLLKRRVQVFGDPLQSHLGLLPVGPFDDSARQEGEGDAQEGDGKNPR